MKQNILSVFDFWLFVQKVMRKFFLYIFDKSPRKISGSKMFIGMLDMYSNSEEASPNS